MKQDRFLRELEERLEENRKLAQRTILPKQLHGLASYLAFHNFRTLITMSLIITAGLFGFYYRELVQISRLIFFYE